MPGAGLVDEVRALRGRYETYPEMPSMRCVGYRQAWSFLDGRIDAGEFREQAIAAPPARKAAVHVAALDIRDRVLADGARSAEQLTARISHPHLPT